ncbi:uncharacterized protein PAC_08743 [Phialocephala subalpina]|uniref:C2H2-type domain-containing protein n=1 Tax=Phialocephala subalpina TaxID=576137 RepID=A0A1L7X1F0_9HELO|nr:uncharacterized protein PAC_08743 [Phialocephala subalpina]
MPSMNSYANPAISNAVNPSAYGYAHGPVPNPNEGWSPHPPPAEGAKSPAVTAAINATAPNPGSVLSKVNSGVCDIDVGTGQMCGQVFGDQPSLRRHMREAHPGAVVNPNRLNTTIQEESAGQLALKSWVRSGGWRAADYVREPGRGPAGGYIDQYATAMEDLARTNPTFAAAYGTHFHRSSAAGSPNPSSSRKRKRGPEPPNEEDPPSPSAGRGKRASAKKKAAKKTGGTRDGLRSSASDGV